MSPRPPYPPIGEWKWPQPGVREWTPPEHYLFGECKGGAPGRKHACPVGLIVTLGKPYGCECPCHVSRPASQARVGGRRG